MYFQNKYLNVMPTILFSIGMLLLTIYIFFPGFLSIDSEWQLQQAKMFQFYDWHPPLMSWWWAMLNHIYEGPTSMLVFHNLVYWTAICLFTFKIFPDSNRKRILLLIFFSLLPSVYIQLGSIWKDTSMAVSLFLVSILLVFLEDVVARKGYIVLRVILISLIVIFLFYSFAIRLNSAPAIIVLALWLGKVLLRSTYKGIIFAILLTLLLYGGNKFFVNYYLHPVPTYPYQQVALHDLGAMSLAQHKVLFPPYAVRFKGLTLDKIKERYHPDSVGFFIFDLKGERILPLTNNTKYIRELTTIWLHSIIAYPWAYLKHRLMTFVALMVSCIAYIGEVCQTPYGITFHPTLLYKIYCKFLTSRLGEVIFHGWVYMINALFSIIAAIKLRKHLAHYHAIFYVALSGFLYTICGFIYTPACEFRYLYWTVTASLFAIIFLAKDFLIGSVDNSLS